MPKLVRPSKAVSDMELFAFDLFKDVTEGPGTPAARMRRLRETVEALASQNYEAGLAAGKKVVEDAAASVPAPDVPGQQIIGDVTAQPGTASGSAPAPAGPVSGGVG